MQIVEIASVREVVRQAGFLRCTLAGFDYRRGLLASTPLPFGAKRPADVIVLGCQAQGDEQDMFRCEW